ncbi:MAG: DUF4328 domain-containing protein [Deltaproteobacteria bacterium]|nr:DUF4328 domain-containing protein [Deltaproteobacteria bacterium]
MSTRAPARTPRRPLPTFDPQHRVVRVLGVFAVVYAAALVVEMLTSWHERSVYLDIVNGIEVPIAVLDGLDDDVFVVLASLMAYLALAASFAVWVIRAGRNVRSRGIKDTREFDEARFLWFFVPVVHLYRPYRAIRELWRGSAASDPRRWHDVAVPWMFVPWWLIWLASNTFGNGALVTNYGATTTEELLLGSELDLGRIILRLLCLPLFVTVVWAIARAQRRNRPATARR